MAYLVAQLVTNAFYTSGIVARDLQVLDQGRMKQGIQVLNSLLDWKSADMMLIPYWTPYTFNTEVGVETYFIENLYQADPITFNIGPLRLPMQSQSRRVYDGSVRVDTTQSLPVIYRVERAEVDGKEGSNIKMFPLPNAVYPIKLQGKFALTNVVADTDLKSVYAKYYIEYLHYELSSMLAEQWDIEFGATKMARLESYRKKLMYLSPPDLTCTKISTLGNSYGVNWAFVNLFTGYLPR